MNVEKVGYDDGGWINLVQDRNQPQTRELDTGTGFHRRWGVFFTS
jgi:hypothetical protein